ncbi:MAG: IS21 family transposase, partial [Solirubrobacterales bacterium]|nr:IS21 family transposase [Solirubrobacterales bacterium]
MKSGRQQVDTIALYEELGSYRAVGAIVGCDHKTVKRYVELAGVQGQLAPVRHRARITDAFGELIRERVERTEGKITARRLWRTLRATGYEGSERSLRRAVAAEKAAYRRRLAREGRVYRPWSSSPGEWLLCDWGSAGKVPTPAGPRPLSFFASVLGYSRARQLTFSLTERFAALAIGLASNLEQIGGAPAYVLFDNPRTVTIGDVAGAHVLNPELVRLASHYRFSPRTTEYYDPESKGKIEAVVRFTKSDLIPPEGFGSLDEANEAGHEWCARVNSEPHSETKRAPGELIEAERELLRALPAARPQIACGEQRKVDRLATIRFASARYSVPHRLVGESVEALATDRELIVTHRGVPVAQHPLLGPGEVSVADEHYPTPAPTGIRRLRPRTEAERAFLELGPEAEEYLRAGAAAGAARLSERISEALELAAIRGPEHARQALDRARRFGRFARGDLEAIALSLGTTPPEHAPEATPLGLAGLPEVPPARSPPTPLRTMSAPLEPELEAGLRRLKLRRVRELAPELLQTARTQRWRPEELLQTLVREEIAAREASNLARRLKAARFPTPKRLSGFDPAASELARGTFSFLGSMEWLERCENLC